MEIRAVYELFAVERGEGYFEHSSPDGPEFSLVPRRVYHLTPPRRPDSAPGVEFVIHLTLPEGDHSWLSEGGHFQVTLTRTKA